MQVFLVLFGLCYALGGVTWAQTVLSVNTPALATMTSPCDMREVLRLATWMVEKSPTLSTGELFGQGTTLAVCTPCSCGGDAAACYRYLADEAEAKVQRAQAFEQQRNALRAAIQRCGDVP